jgi:hypothetical protein
MDLAGYLMGFARLLMLLAGWIAREPCCRMGVVVAAYRIAAGVGLMLVDVVS